MRKPKSTVATLGGLVLLLAATVVAPAAARGRGGGPAPEPESAGRLRPAHHLTLSPIEGDAPDEPVAGPGPSVPFRPTMGADRYRAAKAAVATAADALGLSKQDVLDATGIAGPVGAADEVVNAAYAGIDWSASQTLNPPDPTLAVSKTQVVELVNAALRVYNKNCTSGCAPAASQTLKSFFNYSATWIFDPRIQYDRTWNRWIVIGEGSHESATVQRLFVAVSKGATISTSKPSSSFWRFSVDVETSSGTFLDFPNLGMSQDALLITADRFVNDAECPSVLTIAKARIYNGLAPGDAGAGVPLFGCLGKGTLAPPVQLDQRAVPFLLQAEPEGSALHVWGVADAAYPDDTTVFFRGDVALGFDYTVPPSAAQPGTARLVDTLDSRFAQAGTQVGNHLWNTHVVGYAGSPYPLPLLVDVDPYALTLHRASFYWASATSNDWNASLQANAGGDVFVTFTSDDPAAGIAPQMRVARRDASGGGRGTAVFTSPASFAPGYTRECPSGSDCERWGDYSAVALDPSETPGCPAGPLQSAWAVNETVKSSSLWGTRIARFC
jgi:hypothetical protein